MRGRPHITPRVDVNTLLKKVDIERKKDKKQNLVFSLAAVFFVVIFGAILTL